MGEDFKYAWRLLLKAPGGTLATMLALTLGICLMTYVAALAHAFWFSTLPWPQADRLVAVMHQDGSNLQGGVPYGDYLALRRSQTSLDPFYVVQEVTASLAGGRQAILSQATKAEHGVWSMIAVKPFMGRLLNAADEAPAAPRVAMISEEIWREQFVADPAILGRQVRLNGESATIVGVMPAGFRFPATAQIWLPFKEPTPDKLTGYGDGDNVGITGRLKPGVSLAQANTDFARIGVELAKANPALDSAAMPKVVPFTAMTYIDSTEHGAMTLVAGIVLMLLAWANACNLLLARANERATEMAVRLALGARVAHLLRLLLCEGILLAGPACLLALFLAAWALVPVRDAIATELGSSPFWWHFGISAFEASLAVGLALASIAVTQFLPFLKVIRTDPMIQIRDGGHLSRRNKEWASHVLIALQIAAGAALLSVCISFLWNRHEQQRVAYEGFRTAGIAWISTHVEIWPRYADRIARLGLWKRLDAAMAALPGHPRYALSSALPGEFRSGSAPVAPEGMASARPEDFPVVGIYTANAGFFDALDIPITQGRAFNSGDMTDQGAVAVVDERFAQRYWPQESPLGKTLRLVMLNKVFTVVGVSRPVHHGAPTLPDDEVLPDVYLPLSQVAFINSNIGLIYSGSFAEASSQLQAAIRQADPDIAPDVPVDYAWELDQEMGDQLAYPQIAMFLGASLMLLVVGLYGAGMRAVALRRREIGIRWAIGAADHLLLRHILHRSLWQLAVGLPVGLAAGTLFCLHLDIPLVRCLACDVVAAAVLSAIVFVSAHIPLHRLLWTSPAIVLRHA